MPFVSGDLVYVVLCIADDGNERTHIFSSQESADAFTRSDPERMHILYDYALDCPERHEQRPQ